MVRSISPSSSSKACIPGYSRSQFPRLSHYFGRELDGKVIKQGIEKAPNPWQSTLQTVLLLSFSDLSILNQL